EFSIASVVGEGRIDLLVRLHVRADGTPGVASNWLCQTARLDASVVLRLRPHRRFRLEGNAARPLILIGNGTGMAGLPPHLRARADVGDRRNWLLFGERQAACDYHFGADIEAWREAGLTERVDAVFSRDQADKRYVQHVSHEARDQLREWVERGTAIYVCGS